MSSISSFASSPRRVFILGGGLSGLSLAHFLQTAHAHANPRPFIKIVEKSARLGGWVETRRFDTPGRPFIFEQGPRSALTRNGLATLQLIKELNLQSQVLHSNPSVNQRYLWDSTLNRPVLVPTGLNRSLWEFPLFKPLLSGLYNDFHQKPIEIPDESIDSFITRHFNPTIAKHLFDPLVAGIYSGRTDELSISSCFPLLKELERSYGSIAKGMWKKPKAVENAEEKRLKQESWVKATMEAKIYGFSHGMSTIIQALEKSIKEKDTGDWPQQSSDSPVSSSTEKSSIIRTSSEILGVFMKSNEFLIYSRQDGEILEESSDFLYSTVKASEFGKFLINGAKLAKERGEEISVEYQKYIQDIDDLVRKISYASVWVVNVGFQRPILPMKGFGLLSSSSAGLDILGVTFDSECFPTMNFGEFPDGRPGVGENSSSSMGNSSQNLQGNSPQTRLTFMIGGARRLDLIEKSPEFIHSLVEKHLKKIFSIENSPDFLHSQLQWECIPQYTVGHGERMKSLESLVHSFNSYVGNSSSSSSSPSSSLSRLHFLGSSYSGVSINDLITKAREKARKYYNPCL